jgi:bacillithiol system protein YtxJ
MAVVTIAADTATAWLETLPEGDLVLLYKHSPRCGVSLVAAEEVEALAEQQPELPVYRLDVVRQRILSQDLARILQVAHASPQVILLRGAHPVWNTSHQRIRTANLAEHIEAARRDAQPAR